MYDKLDLEIPFDPLFVNEFNNSETPSGFVSISNYDFKAVSLVSFDLNGNPTYEQIRSIKWDSIASSISQLAVAFFPEGNGFNNWPHVRIKGSPAKILQGHNVYGSESIKQGAIQMIHLFRCAFPKISSHLDYDQSKICYLDCTYSSKLPSRFYVNQIFSFLERISPTRVKVSKNHEYLQFGKNSEYCRQKFYMKDQELMADQINAKKKNQLQKYKILSDPSLNEFASNRLRLEATLGKRKLELLGVPLLLSEFSKFQTWYELTHGEPLCRYLWSVSFTPILKTLEGQTMTSIDDDSIKLRIEKEFINPDARQPRRKANAVWNTYKDIKREGYSKLSKERSSTFFRNCILLEQCGLSRAFLMSIDPNLPNTNVIPLVKLIEINFNQQRPSDFVEPQANYDFTDKRHHLRVVG